MKIVVAGETPTLECPSGSTPTVSEGSLIPSEAPSFYVLKVEGSKLVLGPLKAGDHSFAIECSGGAKIQAELRVQPLQSPPAHQPALSPISLQYPMWFWYTLGGALLFFLLTAWWINRRRRPATTFAQERRPLSLKQRMDEALKNANTHFFLHSEKHDSIKNTYSDLVLLFREVCDEVYNTRTEFFTSREFLATLRNLAPQKGINPQRMGQIESFMLRSDQVRFAKYFPSTEERKMFLEDIRDIYQLLRIHLETEEKDLGKEKIPGGTRKP